MTRRVGGSGNKQSIPLQIYLHFLTSSLTYYDCVIMHNLHTHTHPHTCTSYLVFHRFTFFSRTQRSHQQPKTARCYSSHVFFSSRLLWTERWDVAAGKLWDKRTAWTSHSTSTQAVFFFPAFHVYDGLIDERPCHIKRCQQQNTLLRQHAPGFTFPFLYFTAHLCFV